MTIFSSYFEYISRKKRLALLQYTRRKNPNKVGIKFNIFPNEVRRTGSECRRYRRRNANKKWDDSMWANMLQDDRCRDPCSPQGKSFRNRFRVPYPKFEEICWKLKESGKFMKQEKDCCNQTTVPLEILVLGALRVLGRGLCMDDISELTNVSMEVHRVFFHKFCHYFGQIVFDEYCKPPESVNEMEYILKQYEALGLPGCIGSMDCVHIAWDRAPHKLRWKYIGKEHYPTVAYEVTCTHSRKIIACSKGFPGANNDKTIVRFDDFVQDIHKERKYADVEFKVTQADNTDEMIRGLYLIVDNGYHKWRCLQNPEKWSIDKDVIAFSRHLESVRKDIECTFGILKGRFRILKIPIRFQTQAEVDNIFRTCYVLHNILLKNDGLDSRWESNIRWDGDYGNHDLQDLGSSVEVNVGTGLTGDYIRRLHVRIDSSLDFSRLSNERIQGGDMDVPEVNHDYGSLRAKLITNFAYKLKHKLIIWN